MARKNAIVSVSVEGSVITFTVEGEKSPITIDAKNDLTNENADRALIHGLVQKISDAAALGKDTSPSDKHAAMLATVNRIKGADGSWNKRGDSDPSSPIGGLIFRALRNTRPETDETKLRAWYDGKSRTEQLALRSIPAISAEIERIKSERGSKPADASNLLDELDNL